MAVTIITIMVIEMISDWLHVRCVQHLCRQGRSAVQVTHDLDIFIVDCLDRVCAGDVTRDGVVNPVDLKTRVTGRLHLRLANVGQMSDLKSSKLRNYDYFRYTSTFLWAHFLGFFATRYFATFFDY